MRYSGIDIQIKQRVQYLTYLYECIDKEFLKNFEQFFKTLVTKSGLVMAVHDY